jgi:transposase-like protein
MAPTATCCPKLTCPARGHRGKGNLRLLSRQDQRCLCTECRKTFRATQGTAFDRLRIAADTVRLPVVLLTHGDPLQAHRHRVRL